MKTTYHLSAWEPYDAIRAEEMDQEEQKKLRRRVEDTLRKNREALYLAAAVLVDHDLLTL